MKYEIEVFSALCSLKKFNINGVDADEDNFVNKYDHSQETAEDYGCGNMIADTIPATGNVLEKYKISVDEYAQIAKDVAEKLSFGCCGWCS